MAARTQIRHEHAREPSVRSVMEVGLVTTEAVGRAYWRYWGKSKDATTQDASYHLLAYHSLDVAAVGAAILDLDSDLSAHFDDLLGASPGTAAWLLPFLLSLHDVGKFAPGFQQKDLDLYRRLYRGPWPPRHRQAHHTAAGWLLWDEYLRTPLLELLGWEDDEPAGDLLLACVLGHHGVPPERPGRMRAGDLFGDEDRRAATDFVDDLCEILVPPGGARARVNSDAVGASSWAVAGFAVLCDWLGSNQAWFGYHAASMPMHSYWAEVARPAATSALEESGIIPPTGAPLLGFAEMFDHAAPTPLQEVAASLAFDGAPQLIIAEDLTGAGKTEAALLLVNRLMSAGTATGFFIALPTMATANAMFHRVQEVYGRLFASPSASLVLAHSSSDLSGEFQASIGCELSPRDREYAEDETTASSTCTAWLADSRKKALLAPAGVGTIDQALLAALHCRHQSLRVQGLQRKVLIVDEVHACDSYQNRLLETLLRLHAGLGGSAILLSATLPTSVRRALSSAFAEGAALSPPDLDSTAFPLLTTVSAPKRGVREIPIECAGARSLAFRLISDTESADRVVIEAAQSGRCACWVRNTVRDAVTAARRLRSVLGADTVTLFHARFALGDRLAIESDVVKRFGAAGGQVQRCGRVVIATQVVEQSLDVDFDVMVSDLAPVDLLLQRAGRLHRHARDARGNRTVGPEERGEAELVVLSPNPDRDVDADWITRFLPGTAAVYPDHARLWLTARTLAHSRTVSLPRDSRELVESVFGESAQDRVPATLEGRLLDAEGAQACARSLGAYRAIDIASGYQAGMGRWERREEAVTRLGEPTVTVRLARWDGTSLTPWRGNESNPWRMSELSVRRSVIGGEVPLTGDVRQALDEVRAGWPGRGEWVIVVVLRKGDGESWEGEALDGRDCLQKFRYALDDGFSKVSE